MKKTLTTNLAVATVALASITAQSDAAIILSTGFSGVVENAGPTASGFSWSSDLGEDASTSLTFGGSASGFISEAAGLDEVGEPIGISGNIETAGPWNTSFSFIPSQDLNLTSFDISSYSISGGGAHQFGAENEYTWTLGIDTLTPFSGSDTVMEATGDGPASFSIDLSGVTLTSGTTYTFNLEVSSLETQGNNIALNSLTLNGNTIPEPSSTALIGLAGLGLLIRRRR